jgi:hypothetical protein
VRTTGQAPADPLLAAAATVVAERGPKMKAVLSAMDRGLRRRTGHGTWDAVVTTLVRDGVLDAPVGRWPRRHLRRPEVRAALLARVQAAASGDDELDARTAVLLAMTGPAHLLEVVAPARADRRHARRRIDHALDAGTLRDVSTAVRQVLADAAAATVAATTAAVVASGS